MVLFWNDGRTRCFEASSLVGVPSQIPSRPMECSEAPPSVGLVPSVADSSIGFDSIVGIVGCGNPRPVWRCRASPGYVLVSSFMHSTNDPQPMLHAELTPPGSPHLLSAHHCRTGAVKTGFEWRRVAASVARMSLAQLVVPASTPTARLGSDYQNPGICGGILWRARVYKLRRPRGQPASKGKLWSTPTALLDYCHHDWVRPRQRRQADACGGGMLLIRHCGDGT